MERWRNFGFVLKDTSRRYVARFEQRAREISLTLPQCRVLVQVDKNRGISQARLAALTDIDPMTMVRIIDRMEADGWLERRPDPDDRRARRLYLTRRARPLLDEIWRLAQLTFNEALAGVDQGDRARFMEVLDRVHGNLCALDRAPAAPSSIGRTAIPRSPPTSRKARKSLRTRP
ncbi:MAG TPA: MarR family transcriptional regulator [Casimicrobiaceae bacterium]|nr:MarR family transcriptional regulator [Casimicrobiaceae bacterium]